MVRALIPSIAATTTESHASQARFGGLSTGSTQQKARLHGAFTPKPS